MADVGLAVQRAEDKTAQLQARAGALDELMASGALDEPAALGRGDDIQAELDRISADSGVESELSKLKAQLGQAPAAGELEAGTEPAGA
jgi:phage shock protein A